MYPPLYNGDLLLLCAHVLLAVSLSLLVIRPGKNYKKLVKQPANRCLSLFPDMVAFEGSIYAHHASEEVSQFKPKTYYSLLEPLPSRAVGIQRAAVSENPTTAQRVTV